MSHLAPEVRTTILCVFSVLAIASAVALRTRRASSPRDFAGIWGRLRTWWVIVVLFSLALVWSPKAVIFLLGFISYLALKEFFSMAPTRRADRRVLFYAYLAVVFQYCFAAFGWYQMFIMFIPVLMFVWLPTRMLMIGQTDGFLRAAGTLQWGLMIAVFSLSHAAYLLVMPIGDQPRMLPTYPSAVAEQFPGIGLLVFLILTTGLNDIFQYAWGTAFGRHKVAPTVSPGKTAAGLIGGVATTLVFAVLVGPRLTILDTPRALMAGMIIAVAGFAGDLCLSALKRDLKISNFGATLPGHGGVLDRVDSLIFTAPLFFHFVFYCYG